MQTPHPAAAKDAMRRALVPSLAVILAASPYIVRTWASAHEGYFVGTLLVPADIGLALAMVAGAPEFASALRHRRLGPGAFGLVPLTATLALAWLWHPSGRGVLVVGQLGAAAVLAWWIADVLRSTMSTIFAVAICALGVLEALLAVTQVLAGQQVGRSLPGFSVLEVPFDLFRFGSRPAPYGTLPHPYVLAGMSMVAVGLATVVALRPEEQHPMRWAIAGGIVGVPLGLTFSRTAVLGLAAAGACLIWELATTRQRRRVGSVLVVVALGAAFPALLSFGGWRQRAADTTGSATSATTGRTTKMHQAVTLISDDPLTGVGPGRYVDALERRFPVVRGDQSADQAVHDLPLLAGAEGGILALAAMAVLLGALAWRSVRAGPLALAVYLSFVPFCLLDQFAYEAAQGVVIFAVWLGTVDALIARSADAQH